jgi:Domain of unknown function DUF29
MARSDRREIRNRLVVLLIHLLKYSAQREGARRAGWRRLASREAASRQ